MSDTEYLELPLFPLGTTLFPAGVLSLQIFEVRYLQMIKTCVQDNTPFGVVTLDQGSEIRTPNENISFGRVGTLARIVDFDALKPSLYFIKCLGGSRFNIRNCELKKNGLWVADVEVLEDDASMSIPLELQIAADSLKKVIQSMTSQGMTEQQLPFAMPYLFNDCGWVANRWCELLPLSASQREHLLGLTNPRLRLDLVFDILDDRGLSNPSDD